MRSVPQVTKRVLVSLSLLALAAVAEANPPHLAGDRAYFHSTVRPLLEAATLGNWRFIEGSDQCDRRVLGRLQSLIGTTTGQIGGQFNTLHSSTLRHIEATRGEDVWERLASIAEDFRAIRASCSRPRTNAEWLERSRLAYRINDHFTALQHAFSALDPTVADGWGLDKFEGLPPQAGKPRVPGQCYVPAR